MAQTYRLVGSQDPSSRISEVLVESPSEEHPDGKKLVLDGPAVELSDDQYSKLSTYVRLEQTKPGESAEAKVVDQPGVNRPSQSTDVPPDPGTAPDIDSLNKEELQTELARRQANGELLDVDPKSNKEELQKALRGQGA
jgi:hypothetical protein